MIERVSESVSECVSVALFVGGSSFSSSGGRGRVRSLPGGVTGRKRVKVCHWDERRFGTKHT